MKTYSGSLQRRGRRYYLVIHKDGHQQWFALKTDKLNLARLRAAEIAPPDPREERAWLEQLARAGDRARARLARLELNAKLTWNNLADRAPVTVDAVANEDNRACHAHWIELLAKEATHDGGCPLDSPCDLNAETTALIMASLTAEYRSAPRMLSYFRRLWAAIGLDASIWPKKATSRSFDNSGEHYRRLSLDEVRKIHGALKKSAPSLADMVLIGYSTGLRLSDVAELERSELALPFLSVVPNKTRHRKPKPLRIPQTDEALSVVLRLKEKAEQRSVEFLFDEDARHRPSRRLAAAFRRFGVCKQGNGRASFHSLRATFISLMDEAGVSPHITDAITGHGGGGMHARYTHPSDAALRDAVAKAIPSLESSGENRGLFQPPDPTWERIGRAVCDSQPGLVIAPSRAHIP